MGMGQTMTTKGRYYWLDTLRGQTLIAIASVLAVLWAAVYLAADIKPDLIASIPLGIAMLLVSMRTPYPACLWFIAFSYFRLHEAFPELQNWHPPLLLAAVALLSIAINAELIAANFGAWSPELKLALLFFAITTVSILFCFDPVSAWDSWTSTYWKIFIMMFAIFCLCQNEVDFKQTSTMVIFFGFVVALIAIYNKIYSIDLVEGTRVAIRTTAGSPIGDPNELSLILLFPLSFALSTWAYPSDRRDIFFGVTASSAIILGIVFTQSRGAALGVLAIFALIGFYRLKSLSAVTVLVTVAAVVLASRIGREDMLSGGVGGAYDGGLDESAQIRLYAWKAGVAMALSYPLTGVGINNFANAYWSYTDVWFGRSYTAHSTWFAVLGEAGFPALGVFIAMIVATFKSAFRSVAFYMKDGRATIGLMSSIALTSGLVGFCVSGTFLTQAFNWPIYILIALTTALGRLRDRESELAERAEPAPP
jgi:putative inorganic carbon (hco3(-)) transporter